MIKTGYPIQNKKKLQMSGNRPQIIQQTEINDIHNEFMAMFQEITPEKHSTT